MQHVSLKSVPKDIFQKQFPDCIVLQECKNTLFLRRFEKFYKQFRENTHFFLFYLIMLFCSAVVLMIILGVEKGGIQSERSINRL